MEVKDNREIPITPVILKFGLALAISLGGAVYTYNRIKKIKSPKPKSKSSPGNNGSQVDSRTESGEVRDDDQNSSLEKFSSQNSISDHSSSGDRESSLSPDFNELVKECDGAVTTDNAYPRKNGDSVSLDGEYKCEEHEREIKRLRSIVNILQEKERNLELQLLEYYGIKEQETAVIELQNQLKLNTMEAKLHNLKIESLLLDNRRLEAQVADFANAATELEAAKGKIKALRKKLKFEVEGNREQILKLQDRVMKLQEEEKKAAEIDQDLKTQRQEREELKIKLEEMRICNQVLKQENSDLAQKLDYVKMLAPNALDEEVLHLREESRRLKQQNEDSRKKIEKLQDDRCRDLEELVYLRWINACIRYELRNYQPEAGKAIARDLSKTLSPKIEDEAKKLILEYVNSEGPGEKVSMDGNFSDSDQWSSPASCLTANDRDDLPVDPSAVNKSSKRKLFARLRKLLRGKSSTGRTPGRTPPQPLERTVSVDNIPGRLSCEFPSDSGGDDVMKMSRASSRRSFDVPRSYSRGGKSIAGGSSSCSRRITSDDESPSVLTRVESLTEYDSSWSPAPLQPLQDAEKEELLKFAEALENYRPKSYRSSPSYESS